MLHLKPIALLTWSLTNASYKLYFLLLKQLIKSHISYHFTVRWYKRRPIRVFDPTFKMLMDSFNTNPLTRADKLISATDATLSKVYKCKTHSQYKYSLTKDVLSYQMHYILPPNP
jgi:hypothetical protein